MRAIFLNQLAAVIAIATRTIATIIKILTAISKCMICVLHTILHFSNDNNLYIIFDFYNEQRKG